MPNYTASESQNMNTVLIMPGILVAQQISAGIIATAAYMGMHDAQDQL